MLDSSEDKRKFKRLDARIPLQYKELGGAKIAQGTLTKNLSEGGVRFTSDKFISLACRLVVEMSLPAMQKPVRAISKIAWIKKVPSDDGYEVGNQFLDMTKEDRAVISGFINNSLEPVSE